jgi:hypothetical protein
MAHHLHWFWTTGRFDAAWVQAATNLALLILNFATLVALCIYAWDNHRLAETNEQTLKALRSQDRRTLLQGFAAAYAIFYRVQGKLNSIERTIRNKTFDSRQWSAVFPPDWSHLAVTIDEQTPDATWQWIRFGTLLQKLDIAIEDYFLATTPPEQEECFAALRRALDRAQDGTKALGDILKGAQRTGHR